MDPSAGDSIFIQLSKINNQKFADPNARTKKARVGTDAFVRPASPKDERTQPPLYPPKTRRQYAARVRVTVACAAQPAFRSLTTARPAARRVPNNPYSVDPDPDSDA